MTKVVIETRSTKLDIYVVLTNNMYVIKSKGQ